MPKIILIGSNPSGKSKINSAFDLSTSSGRTLLSWLQRPEMANVEFSFLNVSNSPTLNNRPLTKTEIEGCLPGLQYDIAHANQLSGSDASLVAVGKTAATALTLLGVSFFELPHPSGLNRKLNDPLFIEGKIKELAFWLTLPNSNVKTGD